jgi:hypothetical protein
MTVRGVALGKRQRDEAREADDTPEIQGSQLDDIDP